MKTQLVILSIICAVYIYQTIRRKREKRKQFISNLKAGKHVSVRKKVNGKFRTCQTWVRAVNRDDKTVATPLGQFHFDKIYQ